MIHHKKIYNNEETRNKEGDKVKVINMLFFARLHQRICRLGTLNVQIALITNNRFAKFLPFLHPCNQQYHENDMSMRQCLQSIYTAH